MAICTGSKNVRLSYTLLFLLFLVCTNAVIDNGKMAAKHNLSSLIMTDNVLNLRLAENIDNPMTTIDLSKTMRIRDMLNIFDIGHVAEQFVRMRDALTLNCAQEMHSYFRGIQDNDMWAVKMDDASGHYTSGFFYGNNYWLGSLTLCNAIYHEDSIEELDAKKTLSTSRDKGLPFAKAHTQTYNVVYNENPPFVPSFYIVKMFLNETLPTTFTRTIYVGVCLPSSCSLNDVQVIAKAAHSTAMEYAQRNIKVIDVRMPSNKYSIYENRTFWVLVCSVSMVIFLMATGTWYEIYLSQRLKEALRQQDKEMINNNSETSSGIGCASSDYSDSMIQHDRSKSDTLKELNIVLQLTQETHRAHRPNAEITCEEQLEGHLHKPQKLGIYSELLLSFSIITNYKAICDPHVGTDTIPCIHGLRAFSMAWVILGHTCIVVFKYSDNMEKRKDVEKNFFFQAISNGAFSVDTFFFISGFLISYLYFRTNAKGNLNKLSKGGSAFATGTAHFFGLVLYRFLRLTAPYMFVLGIVQVSMQHLAESSVFDPPTIDHLTCPNYWWRNILYINTLFPVEQMCMIWSWYLANDTQFYIIGAIILIIGVRHLKFATGIAIGFLISAWFTTAVIAFNNNHRPNTDDPLALFDKIYDKPWTRLGPYLVGMAVGWILFRTNCKIRISRTAVASAWTLSIINLLVLVFGLYRADLSKFTAAAYSSLSHTAWAVSLAWITIACSTGYGGYVNSLLSATWLYPFSRITYCAYLVHPIVIRSMALSTDATLHLGGEVMAILFFGLAVASYLLAFLVSLSFEAPFVTMLKILSPSRKTRHA